MLLQPSHQPCSGQRAWLQITARGLQSCPHPTYLQGHPAAGCKGRGLLSCLRPCSGQGGLEEPPLPQGEPWSKAPPPWLLSLLLHAGRTETPPSHPNIPQHRVHGAGLQWDMVVAPSGATSLAASALLQTLGCCWLWGAPPVTSSWVDKGDAVELTTAFTRVGAG